MCALFIRFLTGKWALIRVCYRDADVLQLHPTTSRNWWTDSGTNGKYPDQSDGEPVGNYDRVGNKINLKTILLYKFLELIDFILNLSISNSILLASANWS